MNDVRRARVETYQDEAGEFRWRVIGGNGQGVVPPESHTSEADALRAFMGAKRAMDEAYEDLVEGA